MDINECIRLANEYPVAWMATTEDDQPRVRPLQMWFADTTGFYFHTWRVKNLYREIMKNPRVELGFWIPEEHGGTVLRVAGQVEWVDDPALKYRSFEERPFLATTWPDTGEPGPGSFPYFQGRGLYLSKGEDPVRDIINGQYTTSAGLPYPGNDSWYPGNKEKYL